VPDVYGNLPVVARIASYNPRKSCCGYSRANEQKNGESAPYSEVPRSPDPSRFKNHDLMSHYLYGEIEVCRFRLLASLTNIGTSWKFIGGRQDCIGTGFARWQAGSHQNRMGEFAIHNFGREMFWEIRRLLEAHPDSGTDV